MLKRFFYMSKYFQGPDAYCLSWIKSLEQKYYAFKKKLFGQCSLPPVQCHEPLSVVHQALYLSDLGP